MRQYVRVAPGEDVDVGQVALDTARVLTGKVVDEQGKPCRATIQRWRLDRIAFPQVLHGSTQLQTDASGAFAWSVARGKLLVRATTTDGRRAAAVVDSSGDGLEPLQLVVRGGPPVRLLWRADGPALLATVRDAYGVPLWAERMSGAAHASLLLPRGAYVLEVHRDDDLVRRVEFAVAADPVLLTIEP